MVPSVIARVRSAWHSGESEDSPGSRVRAANCTAGSPSRSQDTTSTFSAWDRWPAHARSVAMPPGASDQALEWPRGSPGVRTLD